MTDILVRDIIDRFRGVRFLEYAPLCEYTTFKIGGPCRLMTWPQDTDTCAALSAYAGERGIRCFVMGNGSNLLAPDAGYEGLVICTLGMDSVEMAGEGEIVAGCGASLAAVSAFAQSRELGGMEFARGIPGTLGGAVFINASAYCGEIKQCVVRTEYCTPDGQIRVLQGEEHAFSYRKSFFSCGEYVILRSLIRLQSCEKKKIIELTSELQARRKKSQPLEYPSAGSVFKRPDGYFAGKLIQDCGLSGHTIGGAQVSEKHAGFIINIGGASEKDVKQLIEHIQKTVYNRFGVELECEIRFLQ